MPETQEFSMDGQWAEHSAGGRRRIEGKDNPSWCKNPQYFLNLRKPTNLKVILRKIGNLKRTKGNKIGLTIARFEQGSQHRKPVAVVPVKKSGKSAGTHLARLLTQTNSHLEPPEMS